MDEFAAIACLVIVGVYILFPEESYFYAERTILQVKVVAMNYYLMAQAFVMYRKISAEARKMGMPTPAFRFTPIWRRK